MTTTHRLRLLCFIVALGLLPATPAHATPEYGLTFDGVDDYVETGTAVIPGSGDFTVEAWAECPAAPNSYREIISQGGSGNAFYIGTNQSNNIRVGDTWGTLTPAVPMPIGGWHHFAVVKSSSNTLLYIDGVLKAGRGSAISNPASSGLRFGRQYGYGGPENWPGSIGDVRIWNRALTAAELQQALIGTEANLIAWWQFNEAAGTTCMPGGSTTAVGTLVNGPVWLFPSALGSSVLTVGPEAINHSVVIAAGGSWTATANNGWLHPAAASGTGGANVVFGCDANTGAPRTGTLTIAGQTLTVTQAGAGYAPITQPAALVSAGLSGPRGVAVDAAGNVYLADTGNNAIKKWNAADNSLVTLVATGLSAPRGVAVDAAGNVYIADTYNHAIRKWSAATHSVSTLVSSGLTYPTGLAVDLAGNVFIADGDNHAVKRWNAANRSVTTLVASGLGHVGGLAVDRAGNVYIADTGNHAVKKWSPSNNSVISLVTTGLNLPRGVAVDGTGSVYIADTENSAIRKWDAATSTVTTLVASGLNKPYGVAADAEGNVVIADSYNQAARELPRAFVSATAKTLNPASGSDTMVILPATRSFSGPFAPTCDQPWLSLVAPSNGVLGFTFGDNPGNTSRSAQVTLLGQSFTVTQAGSSVNVTAVLLGPRPGPSGVCLTLDPPVAPWTAKANVDWLHLATTSGNGRADVNFTCDNNSGDTRSGTLTIAGKTVTVTQAATGYVATPCSREALTSSAKSMPCGIATDPVGNVYFSEWTYPDEMGGGYTYALRKWSVVTGTVSTLADTGLAYPEGVAVDGAGNVFIADAGNNAIKKWNATNGTMSTLVSSGLAWPMGVAVDRAGNVIIADTNNNAIKEWNAAHGTVSTLSSQGWLRPWGVAVSYQGIVYGSNTSDRMIESFHDFHQWIPTGVYNPVGIAVDGSANVYFTTTGAFHDVRKWNAATNTIATVATTTISNDQYQGVALDGAENLYFTEKSHLGIDRVRQAFVDATTRTQPVLGGNGSLPGVLPSTVDLQDELAPTSDQAWLTITGVVNGVVSYTCAPNTSGSYRMATITVLGQPVVVAQDAPPAPYPPVLGTTRLVVGPSAGSDGVMLSISSTTLPWSVAADVPWLHPLNASGTGTDRVRFSYDVNPGGTRSGTLSICGMTLAVTQAGATYQAASSPICTLVSAGLNQPHGVAVDDLGNVFFADTANNAIRRWNAADQTVTTLVDTGVSAPYGVALDGEGNVFIADARNNAIQKWNAASGTMTTLVSSGLNWPMGVAVDGAGNVIIADTGNDAIKKWLSATGTLITLIASNSVYGDPISLHHPDSVAVDAAGNVYFNSHAFDLLENNSEPHILRWNVISNTVDIVAGNGGFPLTVDPGGDVYFGMPIKRWNRTDHTVTTLGPPMGTTYLLGMAVDRAGRIVFADTSNAIRTLIPAYVDSTPRTENFTAGNGQLPEVVPAMAMLDAVPVSNQPWLTITGKTNGVVTYAFAQNTRPVNRPAGITMLGENIPVWQGCAPALGTNHLWEGPGAGIDSVMLNTIYPPLVTDGAVWLHPLPVGESGDSLVRFTFDANPGPTRSATLTIAGQTLTVTQAGSAYVAAPTPLTTLAAGLAGLPHTVAVDGAGNVVIGTADDGWDNGWIGKWNPASNTVTTLVASGLSGVFGITLNGAGDIYASSMWDGAVKKWHPADGSLTTMFSDPSGSFFPMAVAVDAEANIYSTDALSGGITKWIAATDSLVTQSSEAYQGVAIDVAGNLYFPNNRGGSSKWNAISGNVSSIATDQRHDGAAVDGSGNHYFITHDDGSVRKWNAATQTITPKLVTSGLYYPDGVAVDSTGNVYIADTYNHAVKELVRAFVDPTPRMVGLAAGSGTLSQVLPASQNLHAPFAPTSDQPWLTITSVDNGIVGFSYAATTSARTAHISLLGQSIAITQDPQATPPGSLISLAGTSVIENGGGQKSLQMSVLCSDANATLTLLSTIDLTLPLGEWEAIAISPTDAGGGLFHFTIPITPGQPRRFLRVRAVLP